MFWSLKLFHMQVKPLIVVALDALESVMHAGIRGGSCILSTVDWDTIVEGMDDAMTPWLWYEAHHLSSIAHDRLSQ
jgi:hypothetical protein